MEKYTIYKGLQRPLVFKMLKGKYIYWGMGSLIAGILAGGVLSATVSSLFGIISGCTVAAPLFLYTLAKQKKGLHDKEIKKGIYIVCPNSSLTFFGTKKLMQDEKTKV